LTIRGFRLLILVGGFSRAEEPSLTVDGEPSDSNPAKKL
jgi:hypothetical protein